MIFIFDSCHRSPAAKAPVKYEHDKRLLVIEKQSGEIERIEEIG